MNGILQAVESEREVIARIRAALDDRDRILGEIERLAAQLDGAGEAGEALRRPGESKTRALPAARKPKQAKRTEIPGLPPSLRTQDLSERPGERPKRSDTAARRVLVLAAIREMEPARFGDLRRHLDCGVGELQGDLKALRAAGSIDKEGVTTQSRWSLTSTLDRQIAERNGGAYRGHPGVGRSRADRLSDILATIRSDPSAWTEQRISNSGAWDREQVAEACGQLLEDGAIILNPDGTYRPVTPELAGQ